MLSTYRLDKRRCQKVNLTELFINCWSAAKRPQNFIFEELQSILRSIDFRDVIDASKYGVNKQQTSQKNCSQTYKQPIKTWQGMFLKQFWKS